MNSEKPQIHDDYAQKIADICHVPYVAVVALRDQGCLDQRAVRACVMRNDYWALMKTQKFTPKQARERLSNIYDVDPQLIYRAVKERFRHPCFCRECGAGMIKTKFVNNGGLCDRCLAKQINT